LGIFKIIYFPGLLPESLWQLPIFIYHSFAGGILEGIAQLIQKQVAFF